MSTRPSRNRARGSSRPTERQAGLAGARGSIYSFLASLFNQSPTREAIEKLQSGPFFDSVGDLLPEDSLKALKAAGGDLEELAVEHTGLFFAPTPFFVRPHEQHHRPELREGSWRGRVVEYFRRCGYTLDTPAPESADFIGVELDFMAALCLRETRAWKRGSPTRARVLRGLQKRFLDEHLCAWTGPLCLEIQAKARSGLFRGIGRLLEEFVEMDRRALGELSGLPGVNRSTRGSGSRPKEASR